MDRRSGAHPGWAAGSVTGVGGVETQQGTGPGCRHLHGEVQAWTCSYIVHAGRIISAMAGTWLVRDRCYGFDCLYSAYIGGPCRILRGIRCSYECLC